MVHRGQDAELEVAVGGRTVTLVCSVEPALPRPPRSPARLALLNLGLVEFLKVRLDDRAVEPPADAAEVGEDGRQAPQRRVQQPAQSLGTVGRTWRACRLRLAWWRHGGSGRVDAGHGSWLGLKSTCTPP